MFEGERREGAGPAPMTQRADESRLHQCRRDALKSAGCLTCESENTPVRALRSAVIPGRAERREPGIQMQTPKSRLDSGFGAKSAFTRVFDALGAAPE